MNAFTSALDAILAANLPTATEVTAIRLLAEASKAHGQYNCTWGDYLALCDCTNRRAAQRHLTRLSKLRIIHYSTNERVYITFWAWLGDGERAETVHQIHRNGTSGAPNDDEARAKIVHKLHQNGASDEGACTEIVHPTRQESTSSAPNQYTTYTRTRAPGWVGLGNDLDPDQDQLIPNPTQPLTPSQEWTAGLLTDPAISLLPSKVQDIARLHTPAYVVKHVATWWSKRREEGPGVLVYRLLKSRRQCKPNPHPSEEFLESEFWRTHYALAPDDLADELPAPITDEGTAQSWEGVILS